MAGHHFVHFCFEDITIQVFFAILQNFNQNLEELGCVNGHRAFFPIIQMRATTLPIDLIFVYVFFRVYDLFMDF